MLVVLIRSLVDPDVYDDATIYKPLGLNSLADLRKIPKFELKFFKEINDRLKKQGQDLSVTFEMVYSPKNPILHSFVEKIQKAIFDFPLISDDMVKGLENSSELESYMISKNPLVGLELDDSYKNVTTLPKVLKYAIRLPGELRTAFGPMWANWRTDFLFPFIQQGGARNKDYDDGGVPPGYYRESFLTLQNTVFRAFANVTALETNTTLPDFFLRVKMKQNSMFFNIIQNVLVFFRDFHILHSRAIRCYKAWKGCCQSSFYSVSCILASIW